MCKRLTVIILSAIVLSLVVSPATMLARQPVEPDASAAGISLDSEVPAAAAKAGASYRLAGLNPTEVVKLTGNDGAAGDCFGYAVAVSCDTMVVGAEHDDIGSNSDQGSAYVFPTGALCGLDIAKTDLKDPVAATHYIRYTVVVTNTATTTAGTIMLTDTLPAGTYLANEPANAGWMQQPRAAVVTRTVSSLLAGGSISVTLWLGTHSTTRGVVTNTVNARWDTCVVTTTEATTITAPPPPPTATPTPTPTYTPTPTPTYTPTPTHTATPTDTPTPTATPFGPQVTGSIAAYAWDDLNADGAADAGEPPLAGALMQLYATGGSSASAGHKLRYANNDEPIASCTTDETGLCVFSELAAGDYILNVTSPAGYWPTTDSVFEVGVVAGETSTVHFGAVAQYRIFLPYLYNWPITWW